MVKKPVRKKQVIVFQARIESGLGTLDIRASIFKLLASIRASSPLNNILFGRTKRAS